jgi:hypothetical protein
VVDGDLVQVLHDHDDLMCILTVVNLPAPSDIGEDDICRYTKMWLCNMSENSVSPKT